MGLGNLDFLEQDPFGLTQLCVCVLLLQRFRTRFVLKHEHVTHFWMPWCIERKPETTSKTRRNDDVVLM